MILVISRVIQRQPPKYKGRQLSPIYTYICLYVNDITTDTFVYDKRTKNWSLLFGWTIVLKNGYLYK